MLSAETQNIIYWHQNMTTSPKFKYIYIHFSLHMSNNASRYSIIKKKGSWFVIHSLRCNQVSVGEPLWTQALQTDGLSDRQMDGHWWGPSWILYVSQSSVLKVNSAAQRLCSYSQCSTIHVDIHTHTLMLSSWHRHPSIQETFQTTLSPNVPHNWCLH